MALCSAFHPLHASCLLPKQLRLGDRIDLALLPPARLFTTRLQEFAGKKRAGGQEAGTGTRIDRINDERIATPKPRRVRDKDHLRFVASQPCLVCGRQPSQAHHIRHAQPRAMSRKVSDEWAVPLCVAHHRSSHACGDEERWWKERKIDPITEAKLLWQQTQGVKGVERGTEREAI